MSRDIEPAIAALAQDQLEDCRRHFELGDTRQVVQAVRWCITGGLPLPDWVAPEIESAARFYFAKGGAGGRGKHGGNLKRFERARMHRKRHQVAERELARRASVGGTRADAFERASAALAGTDARGPADQIKRSFEKVQRDLRKLFKAPK